MKQLIRLFLMVVIVSAFNLIASGLPFNEQENPLSQGFSKNERLTVSPGRLILEKDQSLNIRSGGKVVYTLPFSQGFDGADFPPADWIQFAGENGLGVNQQWIKSSESYSGSGCASSKWENVEGGMAEDWLVSPKITLHASNNILRFFEKQLLADVFTSQFKIKISTVSQTAYADFTEILSYDETSFGTTWTERVINLDAYAGLDIYIAIIHINDDGDQWFIDNVAVVESIPLTLPVTESFENEVFPPLEWTQFMGTNGLGTTFRWTRETGSFNSGAGCAKSAYEDVVDGSFAEDWLVTPKITLHASNNLLKFFERIQYPGDDNSTFSIRISTTSQNNPADFTTLLSYDDFTVTTSWTEHVIDLDSYAGLNVYIAFVHSNDNGDNWFIDDVTVMEDYPLPVAEFIADVTSGVYPLIVQFTDQTTNSPTSWDWDFGDGYTSSSQNPSHNYTAAGTYTVSLSVINSGGSDSEVKTDYITVTVPAPVADFTADKTSGVYPLSVQYYDQSTNTPTSWLWNFGDEGTSTSQNPSHTYSAAGTYTVTLTATNTTGSDSEMKTDYITVSVPAPVAAFTADVTSGYAPLTVQFTDQSTNIPTLWSWDFGDSNSSTSQSPSHTYNAAGTYSVTLTATNASGSDSEIKTDYIIVTIAPSSYTLPFVEDFENVSFPPADWTQFMGTNGLGTVQQWIRSVMQYYTGVASAAINFENVTGGIAEDWLVTPKITLHASNNKLKYFERQGYSSNYGSMFKIKVSTTSQTNHANFTEVLSYDESTFGIAWTERLINLDAFAGQDIYIAFVNLNDDGDIWFIDDVSVYEEVVSAPVAAFTADMTSGIAPLTVQFTDQSTNTPTSWSWDFGDSNSSTSQSPSHTYNAAGTYTVTLTATNAGGSDSEIKMDYISVTVAPSVDIWSYQTSGSSNWLQSVHFVDTNHGWIAGWSNTLLYTTNGGTTWIPAASGVTQSLYDVYFISTTTGWAVGSNGLIIKSTDGGQNWTAKTSNTTVALFAVWFTDANTGFVAGEYGRRFKTTDGGDTWIEQTQATNNIFDIYFKNGIGYQVGYMKFYKSTDGGSTWTTSYTFNTDEYIYSVEFLDANNGFAAGENFLADPDQGFVYKTTDGGTSWTKIDIAAKPVRDVTFVTNKVGYACGGSITTTGQIWITTDAGATWTEMSYTPSAPTGTMYSVYFPTLNMGFAAGYEGKIVTIETTTAQPTVAAFTADVTTGVLPLTVQFTDQSTNNPISWSWNFGDGNSSVLQNPSHTYSNAGTYTVTLTVSNTSSSDSEVKTDFITVTVPAPVAAFTANLTSGTAPFTVQFTDQSTNIPTSWSWDFGDGNSSTSQSPSHTYNAAGTYTISLTATNAGGSNTLTKSGYITVTIAAPIAAFTADVTTGIAPLTVQFADQSTNIPTSWSWDFGDSNSSTSQSPSHTYNAAGTYTVTLTATNAGGSDSETKTDYIIVTVPTPVAAFTSDVTSGTAPLTVQFTDQSTNIPTSWSWDFGDGNSSTSQSPNHTYNAAGTYTVTLTATNAGGSDIEVKTDYIMVYDPASSITDIDGNIYPFVAIGTQTWMTKNLKTSKYKNGEVIPTGLNDADWSTTANGAFSIYNNDAANNMKYGKLYNWYAVTDTRGVCPAGWHVPSDSEWKTLEMFLGMSQADADNTGPRGTIEGGKLKETGIGNWASPNTGATNEFGFSALPSGTRYSAGNYNELTYFGTYWTSTPGDYITNAYTRFFSYDNSKITRYGISGKSQGYAIRCLKDPVIIAPVAAFVSDVTSGTAPLTVQFTDQSNNTPTTWAWDFGDGSYSSSQSPSHTYSAAGIYTVSLTSTNAGGSDIETKTDYITVTAVPTTYTLPFTEGFENATFPPADWTQFMGTNGLGTVQQWIRTSSDFHTGVASASVIFENVTGGMAEDWLVTPKISLHATNNKLKYFERQGWSANFNSQYKIKISTVSQTNHADFTEILSYDETSFGTTWSERVVNLDSYAGLDVYIAFVFVNDDGDSWSLDDINVYEETVVAPVAAFTASVTSGTAPLTVQFTDQSTNTPTSWSWNFGDGGTSALTSPGHTYTVAGTFTVILTATNAGGSDSETKTDYIIVTVPAPVAAFTSNVTSGTAPLTVQFTDQSTNTPTSWSWNFGDGGTSTSQSPGHTYTTAGTFTVTLTATNAGGSDSEVKTNYITVTVPAPVAAFTASVTSGTAPLTVQFTDQSTNTPTSWSWNFGDGGTSALQSPGHTYTTAGTFTVTLTATNAGGNDSETKTNYITVTNAVSVPTVTTLTITSITQTTASSGGNVTADGGAPVTSRGVCWSVLANPTISDSYTTDANGTGIFTSSITGLTANTTYYIRAYATNSAGTAYGNQINFTTLIIAPVAAFTANITSGTVPLSVQFTDQSTNTPTSWNWNFGDGGTSTSQSPGHTYTTAGSFSVTLTATNAGGNDSEVKTGYIVVSEEQVLTSFSDDFEDHASFSMDFGLWNFFDGDQSTTYGITNVTFPNSGSVMAWMVFNPTQTTPAFTSLVPHSGDKVAACFAATTPPNNDWMISPKVILGSKSKVSFWAKSQTDIYGLEKMKVKISTGTSNIADFIDISGTNPLQVPVEWTEYSFDLTAYANQAIYIAVQCVSNDAFILLMDDFQIRDYTSVDQLSEYQGIEIQQAFPNPFENSTRFTLELIQSQEVQVSIWDLNGKCVTTLFNGILNRGTHTLTWDAHGIQEGMYFCIGKSKTGQVQQKVVKSR